jgi:hypothetical protein
MTPLACPAALQQLQAYYDDELDVADPFAVAAHLDGCQSCRESLEDIEGVGNLLRSAAPGRVPLPCDEASSFTSTVVNRIQVEDNVSFVSTIRDLFEDRRVVYSALGATTATLACLVVMLTMMRFAGIERTDSLAGMMNVLKEPAVVEQPIVIRPTLAGARVIMAHTVDSFLDSDDDSVLALSGVVTSEGRVTNVEINDGSGGTTMASMDSKRLERLVDAVSQTRFEPMKKEGERVAVNYVWFVAHTTVRGGVARKRLAVHVPRIGVIHRV